MTTGIALLNADDEVVTIVRPDVPEGWTPPDGMTACPVEDLPIGWKRAREIPVVVPVIPAWRIRAVADLHGYSATIESAISAMTEPQKTVVGRVWRDGTEFDINSETVRSLASVLGLSEADLADLWAEAWSIVV